MADQLSPRVGQASPDNGFTWDGRRWLPVTGHRYEPTPATHLMQLVVGAFLLFAGLLGMLLATLTRGYVRQATLEAVHRQNPHLSPLDAQGVVDMSVTVGIAIATLVGMVFVILGVLTLLRRPVWLFNADLVVLGLTSLGILTSLNGIARGTAGPVGFAVPNLVIAICALALFAWMLVVRLRIGPWACRRTPLTA